MKHCRRIKKPGHGQLDLRYRLLGHLPALRDRCLLLPLAASSGVATKLRRGQRAARRRQRVGVVEFQKLEAIPRHLLVTRTTSRAAGEFKKAFCLKVFSGFNLEPESVNSPTMH